MRYSVNHAPAGATLHIDTGTYSDTLVLTRSIKLLGNEGNTAAKPVLKLPFTGRVGNHIIIRIVGAPHVTIENMYIDWDVVFAYQAIYATGNFNGLVLKNVSIHLFGSAYPLADTNRNLGRVLEEYLVINLDGINAPVTDTITITGTTIIPTVSRSSNFGGTDLNQFGNSAFVYSVFKLRNVSGVIGGAATSTGLDPGGRIVPAGPNVNDMFSIFGLVSQSTGNLLITGNVFHGGGMDVISPKANSTFIVDGNTFNPLYGLAPTLPVIVNIRYNANPGAKVIVRNNLFYALNGVHRNTTYIGNAITSGGSRNVFIQKNTFVPEDTTVRYTGILVNSSFDLHFSPTPSSFVPNNVNITGNRFLSPANPRSGFDGTGIIFANGYYSAYANKLAAFDDSIVIGGSDSTTQNFFSRNLHTAVSLIDSNTNAFVNKVHVQRNRYDSPFGVIVPDNMANMSQPVGNFMEDRMAHYFDMTAAGRIDFCKRHVFLTGNNGNNNFGRAADSVAVGDTLFFGSFFVNGTYILNRDMYIKTQAGSSINGLIIKSGTTHLNGPLTVISALDLTAGFVGSVRLIPGPTDTVILGPSATYTEGADMFVQGTLKTTRNLQTARETFGGIGFSIDDVDNARHIGPVTVVRTSATGQPATLPGSQNGAIDCIWKITCDPAQRFEPLNITLAWKAGYENITTDWRHAEAWHSDSGAPYRSTHAMFNAAATRKIKFAGRLYENLTVTNNNDSVTAVAPLFVQTALSLYPNPARGQVQITGTFEGAVTVRLSDALGRTVREQEGTLLNLEGLTPGMYQVQVQSKNAIRNGKLMVE